VKKFFRLKKFSFIIILSFPIIIFIFGLLVMGSFKIKKITCQSQFGPCSIVIQKNLDLALENSIKTSKKILTESLTQNSLVSNFEIRFYPPSTYKVFIIEKKQSVAFYYNDEYIILDQAGEILTKKRDYTLPAIVVKSPNISNSQLKFVGKLYRELAAQYKLEDPEISKESFQVIIGDNTVLFPLEGDIDFLLGSLKLTLSWLKKTDKFTRIEIDLRYKSPVLR